MKKRVLSILLAIVLLATCIPFAGLTVSAASYPLIFIDIDESSLDIPEGSVGKLVFQVLPEFKNEQYNVNVYDENGYLVANASDTYYNSGIGTRTITITIDTADLDMGPGEYTVEYWLDFYTFYEWHSAPNKHTCTLKVTAVHKHSYSKATCTKAKTCKTCGATSGSKLGHSYSNSCDKSCSRCGYTRSISHSYKTVTKKATQTANGYTVKRCTSCGKETGKKVIAKIKSIKLSSKEYAYDGSNKTPNVIIKNNNGTKLVRNTDYTVTYVANRKNVGKYSVKIAFKGKYSGSKTLYYTVTPVKTSVSKLTRANTKIKVYVARKTTQVTGYQVQYSTTKSFKSYKSKTITNYKTGDTTLTGLKRKTTYYVRVRTYKIVNGKKYYSAWSAVKTTKTK